MLHSPPLPASASLFSRTEKAVEDNRGDSMTGIFALDLWKPKGQLDKPSRLLGGGYAAPSKKGREGLGCISGHCLINPRPRAVPAVLHSECLSSPYCGEGHVDEVEAALKSAGNHRSASSGGPHGCHQEHVLRGRQTGADQNQRKTKASSTPLSIKVFQRRDY